MGPINWYTEKALRTHKYQREFWERTVNVAFHEGVLTPERSQMLIHGILGMVGESAEIMSVALDKDFETNSMKEMGDWMWYAAIAAEALGFSLDTLVKMEAGMVEGPNISQCSCEIAEHLKKWLFYGREISKTQYASLIAKGIAWIRFDMQDMSFDFQEMLRANVAKLEKRFPESFTTQAAIARADA